MIYIGKAPYRVSLLGGRSDLDWFVKNNGYGLCLGYSLDKYSYSILNILPSLAKNGILEYSTREEYKFIDEIAHPIVRTVLTHLKKSKYIDNLILRLAKVVANNKADIPLPIKHIFIIKI